MGNDKFKILIWIGNFVEEIGFHNIDSMDKPIEGSPFASAYFCKDFLPKDLIVEILEKYDRKLI